MKKKYTARNGSRYNDADAQVFGEEIEKLQARYGMHTPELLVKEAEPARSKLHRYFEWDNTKAGKAYRLQQAREMTQSVVVTVAVDHRKLKIRAFHSVHDKGKPCYVTVQTAVSTESYRMELLNKMHSTLQSLLDLIDLFRKHLK